jgi:rhodanese-related sulfurtransferase
MLRTIAAAAFAAVLALPAGAGEISSSIDPADLTAREKTELGLYLGPEDAHRALTEDPGIVFIDVRSPIEVEFVGIAEGTDANVPFAVKTMKYNPEKNVYTWTRNKNFVADVDAILAREGKTRDDPVFIQCRSGGRSAKAARALIAAGYTQVYNLVEGFEGGKHPETRHRTVAGWRNADLPWHYGIAPEQAWTPGS